MPTRQSCIKAAACGQALPGYRQRQSRYPLRAGRKSAAPDRHRTTRPHTELTSSRVPRQVLGAAAKPKQFLESIFRPEVDQRTQPCAITATQGRIACVCMAPPPVLGEAPHFHEHGCATYASQGKIAVGLANKDPVSEQTCYGITSSHMRWTHRGSTCPPEGSIKPEPRQREQGGTEGGEQILRESWSWLATSATQRGRRCQGPSRTRTSTRLRCLRRWRKRIPTMTTCEHPAVAKAGFMRAGAWRPWATTSCCG